MKPMKVIISCPAHCPTAAPRPQQADGEARRTAQILIIWEHIRFNHWSRRRLAGDF